MSLRGIGRNKKRSASMVGGVVLSMVLILASWGMMDTMLVSIDRQFNDVAIEDATLAFAAPSPTPTSVRSKRSTGCGSPSRSSVSRPPSSTRTRATPRSSRAIEPTRRSTDSIRRSRRSGVLLGKATEDLLDVSVGDEVSIRLSSLDVDITAEVAGFVDEPLATMAYLDADELRSAVEAAGGDATGSSSPAFTTVKAVFDDGADAEPTATSGCATSTALPQRSMPTRSAS